MNFKYFYIIITHFIVNELYIKLDFEPNFIHVMNSVHFSLTISAFNFDAKYQLILLKSIIAHKVV